MPYIDTTDEFLHKALYDYQVIKRVNFGMGGGICFGSTFCHNIFAHLGKLDWWQAVLQSIVSWDRRPESLLNPIVLPHTNKIMSLDAVFRMAAYFLLNHNQIDLTRDDFPLEQIKDNFKQVELLQVGAPVKIITATSVKNITDRVSLVLHGEQDLETFVSTLKARCSGKNLLCFAFTANHVTGLRTLEDLYYFNSNYGESRLENHERGWSHISQIWPNLKLYMDKDKTLGLICISLDEPIDAVFKQVCAEINDNALANIDDRTIHAIANIKPECIPQLLAKIDQDQASEVAFEECLAFRRLISSPSTLQTLLSCAPNSAIDLLALIDRKPLLKQAFAKSMKQKVDYIADLTGDIDPNRADCRTSVEVLVNYAPQSFAKLVEMVSSNDELLKSMQVCLANKDKNGVTFLDRIKAKNLPEVSKLLALLNLNVASGGLNQVSMFRPAPSPIFDGQSNPGFQEARQVAGPGM